MLLNYFNGDCGCRFDIDSFFDQTIFSLADDFTKGVKVIYIRIIENLFQLFYPLISKFDRFKIKYSFFVRENQHERETQVLGVLFILVHSINVCYQKYTGQAEHLFVMDVIFVPIVVKFFSMQGVPHFWSLTLLLFSFNHITLHQDGCLITTFNAFLASWFCD